MFSLIKKIPFGFPNKDINYNKNLLKVKNSNLTDVITR